MAHYVYDGDVRLPVQRPGNPSLIVIAGRISGVSIAFAHQTSRLWIALSGTLALYSSNARTGNRIEALPECALELPTKTAATVSFRFMPHSFDSLHKLRMAGHELDALLAKYVFPCGFLERLPCLVISDSFTRKLLACEENVLERLDR